MRRYLLTTGITAFILMGAPATGGSAPDTRDEALESTTVAVRRVTVGPVDVTDEVAMVLIGSALIALAAAVRRADWPID